MERFVAYLETIEEINRAERRLAKRNDATSLALLESRLGRRQGRLAIPTR